MCAAVGLSTPLSLKSQQTFVPSMVTSAVPELVVEIDVGTSAELDSATWKLVPFVAVVGLPPPPRVTRMTASAAATATAAARATSSQLRPNGAQPPGRWEGAASGGGGSGGAATVGGAGPVETAGSAAEACTAGAAGAAESGASTVSDQPVASCAAGSGETTTVLSPVGT